ncbi:hypothetical protein CEXT_781281 [Caerostris extrusa]|uniref:Uncharacterized protein n=1 Tax=Caerostris extrusa TaxID=172846 RepID=A0AAV4WQF3_CAEEX|nr:hypothetical protein CEXT_781281 [Caerostris extrusa]
MVEIHHSVKDHDKPLKLQDGSVEKYVDDIIKDEFKDDYKKVRDLKDDPSIIESASAWTNDNSTLQQNATNITKMECFLTTENYTQKEVEPVYQKNNVKSEISKPGELLFHSGVDNSKPKINMPINITEGFPSSGEIIKKHESITKEIKITENDLDIFFRTTIKPSVSNNTYTSKLIFESMIEFPTPPCTTTAKEPLTLGTQKIGDTEIKIIETNMENFQRPATISIPQTTEMLIQQVAQGKPIQVIETVQENLHAAYNKDASINTHKVTPENEAIVNAPLIGSQNVYSVKNHHNYLQNYHNYLKAVVLGAGRKSGPK